MRTAYISMSYDCNEKCIFCPCSEPGNEIAAIGLEEIKSCIDRAMEGSIHSHIPEKHDRLTQLPNSFHKSLKGLHNIIDAGILTSVKYNIIRYTYHEMPGYIDWLYETFPDKVSFLLCNIDITGVALKNKDLIGVTFEKSAPFLEQSLDKVIAFRQNGRKRNVKVFTTPLCTLDPYYWGFVNNETKDNLAALRVPSEDEANDRLFLEIGSDSGPLFAPCQECALRNPCPGTWKKTGELFGDSIFKPVYATE